MLNTFHFLKYFHAKKFKVCGTSFVPVFCYLGVMLAILESLKVIRPVIGEDGVKEDLSTGSVAAGYQNFLICIEMFFAAIALKYAFPISVYIGEGGINAEGRSVTMQSISSSLKVFKSLLLELCKHRFKF